MAIWEKKETIKFKLIYLQLFVIQEITSNPSITEEEAAKLIAIKMESTKRKNYGYYRVGALRSIGGGRKVVPNVPEKLKAVRYRIFFLII